MTVTAIEPQKNDPNRRNIFADGKFIVGISLKVLEEFSLKEGDKLTSALLSEIVRAENIYRARKKALNYLEYSEHTKKSMLEKLIGAGFSEETAQSAVSELINEKIINDVSYAQRYAYYLYTKKYYGSRRVIMELMKKGVSQDIAQEAAKSQMPEDISELIRILIMKRMRKAKQLTDKDYDKAFAYLLRYGHEYKDIREALSEFF